VTDLQYASDRNALVTNAGTFVLNIHERLLIQAQSFLDGLERQPKLLHDWVHWEEQALFWLPPKFRPSLHSSSQDEIGIGYNYGWVHLLALDVQKPLLLNESKG